MRSLFESARQDFGYAIRQLRSAPGFTLSAVACLAIGVWLACIVSAFGRGVYRPELGFARPDRVIQIEVDGAFGRNYEFNRTVSRSVIEGLRNAGTFAAIGDYRLSSFQLAEESKTRPMTFLSSGMFGVFGIRPHIGRGFIPAEDEIGTGDVVMLSYAFWQSQYAGDTTVLGRQLHLNKGPTQTIVGVMPKGFAFPRSGIARDLYVASGSQIATRSYREKTVKTMLARLHDTGTVAGAEYAARNLAVRNIINDREELVREWRARKQHYSTPDGPILVTAVPYHTEPISPFTDRLVALIIGCGVFVVMIACANVANLLLVRGASRRQEIAVRMALGASRLRIVIQLIAESVLLSLCGTTLGFIMAFGHWKLLDANFSARHMLGEIDRHVALIAAILGVTLIALFGLLPALRSSSMRLEQVLRDVRRSGMGVTRLDGLLARLIIGSTAATVVLLASAALLGLSAREMLKGGRRLDTKNVLAVDLIFDPRTTTPEVMRQSLHTLGGLSSGSGVRSAALAPLPSGSSSAGPSHITPAGGVTAHLWGVDLRPITGGYFQTMGIRLVAGRTFTSRENRDSVGSVIISEGLAKRLWPGTSAVGKTARASYTRNGDGSLITVIGVAADVMVNTNGLASYEMYVSLGSSPPRYTTALVKFDNKKQLMAAAKSRIATSGAGLHIGQLMSLDDRARDSGVFLRYISVGFALFAAAGLILVAIGLYGVIAFSVARRTHEIGVRLALGATARDVGRMVTRHGLRMTMFGTAIGLLLSLWSAHLLRGFMPEVDIADPRVSVGVILVVAAVSLTASYLPSRRAAKLDPMDALRAE